MLSRKDIIIKFTNKNYHTLMSSRVRFIDLVRPVMGLLPEVEQPLKKVRLSLIHS